MLPHRQKGDQRMHDEERIRREYRRRQSRQFVAIALVMFDVLLGAVLHKRTGLLGLSRQAIFALQAIGIAAFAGFTAWNWRCPACNKYLGSDVFRERCKACGTRLQ